MVQKVEPEIIGIVTTDNPEFKFKVSIKSQPWPIQINQLIQYCPLPFQHKWYDAMTHFFALLDERDKKCHKIKLWR